MEQISTMSQKSGDPSRPGLLEYLEEIIGSNIYLNSINEMADLYAEQEEVRHMKGEQMKIVEN